MQHLPWPAPERDLHTPLAAVPRQGAEGTLDAAAHRHYPRSSHWLEFPANGSCRVGAGAARGDTRPSWGHRDMLAASGSGTEQGWADSCLSPAVLPMVRAAAGAPGLS